MFVFERRMREGGWEKSRKVTDTRGKESENVCVEDDNSEAKSSRARLLLIAVLNDIIVPKKPEFNSFLRG